MGKAINLSFNLGNDDDGADKDSMLLRAGVEDSVIGTTKKINIKRIDNKYILSFLLKPLVFFNDTTSDNIIHCQMECTHNTKKCAHDMVSDLKANAHRYDYALLVMVAGHLRQVMKGYAAMAIDSIAPTVLDGHAMHKVMKRGLFYDTVTSGSHYKQLLYNDITHLINVAIVPQIADKMAQRRQFSLLDRILLYNFVPDDSKSEDLITSSYPLLYAYANSKDTYYYTHRHFTMDQIKQSYKYLLDHAAILQISNVDIAKPYAKPLLNKQAELRLY